MSNRNIVPVIEPQVARYWLYKKGKVTYVSREMSIAPPDPKDAEKWEVRIRKQPRRYDDEW